MKIKAVGAVLVVGAAAMMPRMGVTQMDQNNTMQAPGPQSVSPQNANAQGTQTTSMRDSLGAPGQNGQAILDKQFVRTAVEASLGDVKLGALAAAKGGPQVKELGQKMVDDHTQMGKDLGNVADSRGVMVPKKLSMEDQAEYDKLNGLSGKDFDTEYLTYVAKAHWQQAHDFRMESSIAVESELQSEVLKDLGVMREHLGLIAKTANEAGVPLPRPQRPNATSASAAH